MNVLSILVRRVALGLVTAWAILTVFFLSFTVTRDWVASSISGATVGALTGPNSDFTADQAHEAAEQRIAEYAADRGLDRPLYEQYLDWMGNMLTLDWGESLETGEPAFGMVVDATLRTAMYVVPATVLAVCLGLGIGLYAALQPGSRLADTGRLGSYLMFGVPSFWLGGLFVGAVWSETIGHSALLFDHILPIALVTMTLLGGYVSYSRAYALEEASEEFVTLVRAKGAGPVRIARHIVRNAAIPMFSMLFTEALGLLMLAIFVIEVVFGIEGFGLLFFFAMVGRDIPVILGAAIVIIAVGVVGNILQDISYQYLDPRVGG